MATQTGHQSNKPSQTDPHASQIAPAVATPHAPDKVVDDNDPLFDEIKRLPVDYAAAIRDAAAKKREKLSSKNSDIPTGVYKFTMRGEYFVMNNHGYTVKRYEGIVCAVPKAAVGMAMSYIRSRILPPLLKRKYEDFADLRTFHIQRVEAPSVEDALTLPLDLMDRDMLLAYIEVNGLEINTSLYSRAVDLKRAILDYKDDPVRYLKAQKENTVFSSILHDIETLNNLEDGEVS